MCFSPPAFLRCLFRGGLVAAWLVHSASGDNTLPILSNLTRDFDGQPVIPTVTTDPPNQPVSLVYRDLSPGAAAGVTEQVFNNIPDLLPLSYSSLSFAGGVSALGNYIRLGGTSRKLESCDVVLVNWARASDYPVLAAAHPAGYPHPVTLSFYSVSPSNILSLLTTRTITVPVPWRPDRLPNGSPYPFNGYAFRASFDFPDGIILPEQVMVMVDYDTQTTGFDPIGQPGPYNTLNVALDGGAASVGTDVNADEVLRVAGDNWYYPNTNWTGFNGPMIRLRARSSVTRTPPVVPGSYEVTAIAGPTGTGGTVSAALTILPPSLAKWQAREFTEAQRTSGASAPQADPDDDGLTNLSEFALGTSPNAPALEPPWVIDEAGLSISLNRPRWLTGVNYTAEESSDLGFWEPIPLEVVNSTVTRETVRATASPAGRAASRTFLRIRFSE